RRQFIRTRRAEILAEIADGMPEWVTTPEPPFVIGDFMGEDDEDSIWTAVRRGDVEELKEHLADGAEVNERNDDGTTLLSMAALAGEIETVQLLIDEGADLDAKNNDGNTALHGTAFLGRLEMTNLLIESGADVNIRNNDGTTPLDNAAAEWSQELEGAVGVIAGILRIKAEVSEVKVGRPRVAAVLRTQGGTHGSGLAIGQTGQGEIGRLVKDGDLASLREAFTKGADVNGLDAQGITPLSWAAMADQLDVVKLLIDLRAEVNGKNRDGATPLHGAAGLGRTEIVELLLSKGADVNVIDGDGQTPLDKAAVPWSAGLEGLMRVVAGMLQLKVEVSEVKTGRSQVAEMLKEKGAKTGEALR
ncbi:MAG: ankyrin repeat domain-containing protein, partial [Planctomycetes bacterium]|nr:ankyrin repeat domain-containing protein [Planctomycetota bacterium]